jgi:tetratricopeptide (TPR) repeat protein
MAILRRFASISISETKTQARGYIWPMAIKGAFENKKTTIIGLGQENFNYVFNANYNPNMWRHEQWFDRAHNSYLDWLVAGGLLGLISYLTIFIFAFLAIIKSDISINKKATLLGVIIAYGIQSIFTFDNLTSYLYFIIILSIIATQRSTKLHNWISKILLSNSNNYPIIRDYLYTPIVLILFIITIYTINVRPIQANTRLIDAMISCSGGQNLPSVEAYQNALKLDQYVANQEIREQSLSCGTNIIRSNLPQSAKETFAYFVVTNIDKQINITPNDARAFYLGGTFLDEAGNWSAANVLLERANQLSPNKQSIMLELATNYINSNRMSEAVEVTKKAYELATDNDISRAAYISVLIVSGQEAKAKEVFSKQSEAFYDERIVNAYMNKKQFDKAAQIYKKLIENNPENKQYYLQLAGVYFASGNKYSTIQELKLIGDKFPESKKQIDDAIKEVEKKLQ